MEIENTNLEPNRGTTILVLGILGIAVCAICGIFAWVMGNEDLRKIKQGVMDSSNIDYITIGRILGIVSCVLMIIGIFIGIFAVLLELA